MNDLILEGMKHASSGATRHREAEEAKIDIPRTNDELWRLVKRLWNLEIPRTQVCPDHVAPFDAFADAYFARDSMAVWHASRGLGGKSVLLAALALTEGVTYGAKINLLGGSGEQSERVLKYMYGEEVQKIMWEAPGAPRHLVKGGYEKGALKRETTLTNHGYIRALMASSRSVRGPHPERLRLDEIDEMALDIFESAMGQTMATRGIDAQTVASSTWHNADGTMTQVLDWAEEKGWPVYRWCFKENLRSNGGWLPQSEVDRKRRETSSVMFRVEYELQEPNPESRAIDPDAVKQMFNADMGVYEGALGEHICIEPEVEEGEIYVHAADWGKRKDFSVIWTFKVVGWTDSGRPLRLRLVEFERTGRRKWPFMVGLFEKRIQKYLDGGAESHSAHDETGIGDVIGDYMEGVESEGYWLTGKLRYTVLNDYISAIEHGHIEAPMITFAEKEHRLAAEDDLFGSGHPPDTIVAGAIAHHRAKNLPRRRKVRATWGS